jgi:hypothetical protein
LTSVRVALAVGLVLTAVALVVVLSGSRLVVAGTNSIPTYPAVGFLGGGTSHCQPSGTVPQGTTAIRISASADTGPSVTLKVLSAGRPVTSGERAAGWGIDETVTVPVARVARTIPAATICVAFGQAVEPVLINGTRVPTEIRSTGPRSTPESNSEALRLRVEYLRPGPDSWWSMVSSVAHRMGLGHWPSGTWIVFVLLAIMLAIAALASRLVLGELR